MNILQEFNVQHNTSEKPDFVFLICASLWLLIHVSPIQVIEPAVFDPAPDFYALDLFGDMP